jgi:hypothetical protein
MDLQLAKRIYNTWAAVCRAGFYVEVMQAYARYQIQLTHEDLIVLKGMYRITCMDDWERILFDARGNWIAV